jgi:hypothetical protein
VHGHGGQTFDVVVCFAVWTRYEAAVLEERDAGRFLVIRSVALWRVLFEGGCCFVIQGLDLVLWTGGMRVDLSHFPGYLWFFT